MHLHLPNSAFLGNIDPFLKSLDLEGPDLTITANRRWISIHPVVLAMAAALGREARNVICEPLTAKSAHYLERMGLFTHCKIGSGISITAHEPAGRFIPLTIIKEGKEFRGFLTEMIPLLHLEERHAEPIKYVVSELIRNVLEHAETDAGAIVCAQYSKSSNTIRLGIADRGIGIRQSIRRAHPTEDDVAAIRLALMPGITGTTRAEGGTAYNAGAGLFFIKSLAAINKDHLLIYSGDACYKLLKSTAKRPRLRGDPFDDRHTTRRGLPRWRGTVVGIDLQLNETEEFTHLLDLIKEAYTKSIRERKRTKREARFI